MGINLQLPGLTELRPRITVIGVGGAGGNAVNNMIESGLTGVDFIAANTDAQALSTSSAGSIIQMGVGITEGLGAGSKPEIGAAAAEESLDEIRSHLDGSHLLFIAAGMGGGTGTGAAPVIARTAKELGILTIAVVTKPFEFEGQRRMRAAEAGIIELAKYVDTLIVIPNQNLFLVASEKTTFADAFMRADDVLKSGVCCITDLMVKDGLINLDFADVRTVMQNMGTALMGTGEAEGEKRALQAAEAAIANPLLGEISMRGAKGLLVSITGSYDMTLFEVEEAASRIRREVDPDENPDVNIIVGATFDPSLQKKIRVSVVATGIKPTAHMPQFLSQHPSSEGRLSSRLKEAAAESGRQRGSIWKGNGLQKTSSREAASGPRVVLEPKGKNGAGKERYDAQDDGRFDPVPPSKTTRPPRRPLTYEDFPELNESAGARGANRNSGKSRGLLGWMFGKNRSRDSDHYPYDTADAVTFQQRSPYEKQPQRESNRNGLRASYGDYGERDGLGGEDGGIS
ncbi:MAG TPA: cell division protein FtsZ, partial [Hyphomicrobiales bacterium]|nr:cell division protein FtsZ [Hyphomicrobiales bacterium]